MPRSGATFVSPFLSSQSSLSANDLINIATRLIIGVGIGVPATSLCINRRLYHIAACTSVAPKTAAQKRRDIIIDLCIGIGLPVLQMIIC